MKKKKCWNPLLLKWDNFASNFQTNSIDISNLASYQTITDIITNTYITPQPPLPSISTQWTIANIISSNTDTVALTVHIQQWQNYGPSTPLPLFSCSDTTRLEVTPLFTSHHHSNLNINFTTTTTTTFFKNMVVCILAYQRYFMLILKLNQMMAA